MDRYEEALERAKAGKPMDEVFPELKESEDERVRKWLIEEIKATHDYDSPTSNKCVDDALAYLERQKVQKPDYCHNEVDLSGCSDEYRKAYYDGWNNCNQQHAQLRAEQKPAEWNEEDEERLNHCISLIEIKKEAEGRFLLFCGPNDLNSRKLDVEWLKSIRPHPHWKPSEEQMVALNQSLSEYGIDGDVYRNLCSLYDDLKKLM